MPDAVYAYFNKEYVPIGDAKVGVMTHAFNYGTGCFEGIRAYWNDEQKQLYVFRMAEHYARLLDSCRILRIEAPGTVEELCGITTELLRRNQLQSDVYIRPIAYKSSEVIGVKLHGLQDSFTIWTAPLGKYIDVEGGCRVMVSSWRRVDDNIIPARAKITGSYVNSAFAKSEAVLNGFDEAIMLTAEGHVSEGSGENAFMIRKGEVITPPVSDNILVGITRDTAIRLFNDELGLKVTERPIDRSELYIADEFFLCGTGAEISPVVEVDHRPVGTGAIGPITRRLMTAFFDAVKGKSPKYMDWCTPVYTQAAAEARASSTAQGARG